MLAISDVAIQGDIGLTILPFIVKKINHRKESKEI